MSVCGCSFLIGLMGHYSFGDMGRKGCRKGREYPGEVGDGPFCVWCVFESLLGGGRGVCFFFGGGDDLFGGGRVLDMGRFTGMKSRHMWSLRIRCGIGGE